MFGNDDQNQQPQDNPQAGQVTNPTDPNAGSGLNLSAPVDDGSAPTDKPAEGDASSAPILSNDAGSYIATDPPGITPPAEPAASSPTLPASDSESIDSAVSSLTPPMPAPDTPSSDIPAPSTTPAPVTTGSDDLLNIKQQALQQLSPLVGHLDQTPEEKFRTTMM